MKYLPHVISVLFFCSCSSHKLEFEKSTGKVNEVVSGKPFHINVPEDHASGYSWSVEPGSFDENIIIYMGSVYHSTEKGSVDFNFEAVKPGKTEIRIFLRMHKDTSTTKYFLLEVK
jgi:predicted secreted protein